MSKHPIKKIRQVRAIADPKQPTATMFTFRKKGEGRVRFLNRRWYAGRVYSLPIEFKKHFETNGVFEILS